MRNSAKRRQHRAAASRPWLPWPLLPAVLLLLQAAGAQAFPELRVHAERLHNGDLAAADVALALSSDGAWRITAGQLKSAAFEREGIELSGRLGELSSGADGWKLESAVRYLELEGELGLVLSSDTLTATLDLPRQALSRLGGLDLLPPQAAWLKRGSFEARVSLLQAPSAPAAGQYQLSLADLSFDSPDGRFAGEGLTASLSGEISLGEAFNWQADGSIGPGQLLLDRFYADFSTAPLGFTLHGAHPDAAPVALRFDMADPQALRLRGRAISNPADPSGWDVEIDRLELQFPLAYERYIESMAAAWTLDGLTLSGRMNWSGAWRDGVLQSGDLDIEDLSVVDTASGRFALSGLHTRLRPGDYSVDSMLEWQGLLFGRINLGSGQAQLDSEPGTLALAQPLDLDVLGGRLHLEKLRILLPGSAGDRAGESAFRLQASLHELEMERLTRALDWPRFGGVISGEIPGASLDDGVLDVDGEIRIRVFDGEVTVGDLRVERPFGVLPSLAANIEMDNLDLAQLTETFEFGSISGRIDGYMRDLRMLDWRPVAFDAWLGTPLDQGGSQGISRQAVNRLTTIGGGGATTALAGPVMGLFSKFSYKRLGLGCRLQNNVCDLRGLGEQEGSVVLLEGAGIPKITIRAFNRSVDWPQMLSNLSAVGGEQAIRIGTDD